MKISFSWLREYLSIEQSAEEIAKILTEIGLEVEGIGEYENIKGSLEGLIVGEVISCEKHPNADRLSVTKVDIGSDTLHIVCGAPNVATGQRVVVAPIGTTLFDKDGQPWTIKKGKIRGEVSEGMICAEDEIGLGVNHDGIVVLPENYVIGKRLADYFDTSKDTVFEIGLTPNRSDATSHLGVARDLAAALKVNYGFEGIVHEPDVSEWEVENTQLPVQVIVHSPEGCPRYCGVSIGGLQVKESPAWLRNRLLSIGVRPINNIVDATNYVLQELGQPLHAFDLDKVTDHKIKVQTLPEGSTFISLDEQARKLSQEDLMICDGSDNGMCIAGVFGGFGSGVSDGTQSIFLESAHFNARWTRRSSERHLLFTDAAKVFEKGSDPNLCLFALKRAALLIKDLAGGYIASEIFDFYPNPVVPATITLRFHRLNQLIGTELSPDTVRNIVHAMGMSIIHEQEDYLTVQVPTNKVDVTREADLIEEVLRIYGFNRVPISDRMSFRVGESVKVEESMLRNQVADFLTATGFNEIMGLSMIDKKYLESSIFGLEEAEIVCINNTSNEQMEVMRPNLWITALETIRYNQYRQQNSLRLFEFGKNYKKNGTEYSETEQLAITISGWSQESWLQSGLDRKHEFFALKSVIENILALYGIDQIQKTDAGDRHFSSGLLYVSNGLPLVSLGMIRPDLCQEMDLRNPVSYAAIDWQNIVKCQRVDQITVTLPSRFPVVRRDLALVVDQKTKFSVLQALIAEHLGAKLAEINLFDLYLNEELIAAGKKSYALSILLSDNTKTFSDKEIDLLINGLVKRLEKEAGARLR